MATTPVAAPETKSTIGLKNLVVAPIVTDNETTYTVGDLQLVAGAIDATVTPNNPDPDKQYADDIEFDVFYPDPDTTFAITLAGLPLTIQSMLLGNEIDENGVLVRKANDKPGYFAVGFKSQMTNGKYRYVWFYKCLAKPITESYGTKQGTTIDRKTQAVEFSAIKRTKDNNYQAVADLADTDTLAATFLTSVYEPDWTPAGSGD